MSENSYFDEYGRHLGYCNGCGDECLLESDCADPDCDGEVVPYDDDPDPGA